MKNEELLALAPVSLVSFRRNRPFGDALNVPVDSFSDLHRGVIFELYSRLGTLQKLADSLIESGSSRPESALRELIEFRDSTGWTALIDKIKGIQPASSAAEGPGHGIAKALHDIRGGALGALHARLSLLAPGAPASLADPSRYFFLARDHRKIMRNAISGLDIEIDARDRERMPHSIDLIRSKWSGGNYHDPDGAPVQIRFHSGYEGDVSGRCIEFSALDRCIYNLVNNAARHASDRKVDFDIIPLPTPDGGAPVDLRIVISNEIPLEQESRLETRFKDGLNGLFLGGFTTGGNGLGMRICTDLVMNAYSLTSTTECIKGGYVGARILRPQGPSDRGPRFVAWFHWPVS